jgi:hypothetical protein
VTASIVSLIRCDVDDCDAAVVGMNNTFREARATAQVEHGWSVVVNERRYEVRDVCPKHNGAGPDSSTTPKETP